MVTGDNALCGAVKSSTVSSFLSWVNTARETAERGSCLSALYAQQNFYLLQLLLLPCDNCKVLKNSWWFPT